MKHSIPIYWLLSLITGCAQIEAVTENKKICEPLSAITSSKAHFYSDLVLFEDKNKYSTLDLNSNSDNCRLSKNNILHSVEGDAAAKVQSEAILLAKGKGSVEVIKISKLPGYDMKTTTKQICKKIKLGFMFEIDHGDKKIIGCQQNQLSTNAVMFRESRTEENSIEIAALKIFDPLLNDVLNELGH
jgi:hypothetical protein